MLYLRKTLDVEYSLKEADTALIGMPFDSTEIGQPVRYGPLFLREAIRNLVGFDPELGLNIFEGRKIIDLGDIEPVPGSWELTRERVLDTLKWLLDENPKIFPVFLGGEHLVTLGILEGLSRVHKKITVVDFDAHRDLRKGWLGNEFSHVTWAGHILDKPNFELIQPCCRIWDKEEPEVRKELKGVSGPVYITLDLDVLDPSHAPEVGTPEPGGISPGELFGLLEQACRGKVIGLDIVECASQKVGTQTALLGAQAFKKVLGFVSKKR